LIKSSHIKDEAAEICSTSKVSLDRVSPVVFLSKYDFGNLRRLVNMSTLILITTLLEIQELVLTEIKEKIELRVIIENNMIAKRKALFLERFSENKLSTIRPVISGIEASNAVAKAIIIETKMNLPK
jgi:hypothetical protein|tara:strand:- start:91 stop:471 length:381 start_codon:yes stop_codon:yes gene_type:complete